MPQANIFDRFLRLLGKKRGVIFPSGAVSRPDCDVYARAGKENFWTALFRSSNQALPQDLIDIFEIEDFRKEIAGRPVD